MRVSPRSIAVAAAACASVAAAVVVVTGACIVVPPPDLGLPPPRPPRILHDSVVPPTDEPLLYWPYMSNPLLFVPVVVDDPNRQYEYRVFVDDNPTPLPQPPPPSAVLDGGSTTISISINPNRFPPIDTAICHSIKVVVARTFPDGITPDSLGSDHVEWKYGSCVVGHLPEGSADGPPSEGGDP